MDPKRSTWSHLRRSSRAFGNNVETTVSVEATPIDAVSSELGVIRVGRRERLTTAWQQQSEWGVHYALLESSIYIYIDLTNTVIIMTIKIISTIIIIIHRSNTHININIHIYIYLYM